jgi:hypothetical protein
MNTENDLSDTVCEVIFWLSSHSEDLVMTDWSRRRLSYDCGRGGYPVVFRRHAERDSWVLDEAAGESVGLTISPQCDELDDLISALDHDADHITMYVACDPDDPMRYRAAYTEETDIRSAWGDMVEPTTVTVCVAGMDDDDMSYLLYDIIGPDDSDEILTACWALAHYAACCELLGLDPGIDFDPFEPDTFCNGSDLNRHGQLWCDMVAHVFGAEAGNRQAAVLRAENTEEETD